jgi:nitroreductase
MGKDAIATIRQRTSSSYFQSSVVSEETIRELVRDATEAPSSFNIQHWRFIAVTDAADKQKLQKCAFDQEKVSAAAVTFIVLGDMEAYDNLSATLEPSVAEGMLTEQLRSTWVDMATNMYSGNPQFARDEAVRSASLAAMTLMVSAQARGLVSGPMVGFEASALQRAFEIGERFVPVMLIAIGHPSAGNAARKPRLPVERVLSFNRMGPWQVPA